MRQHRKTWFIFGGQSKMNIFFTSYATLVTRLMWHLCWLSRNMAEIWQPLAALAASDSPWRLLFKKLAMKNSSASRNDISIWKCWALYYTRSLFLFLRLSLSLSFSLALSTWPRWQWVREIYRPQHILGFGLTCFAFACLTAMVARAWQTFWHAIYHPSSSSKGCWWSP